MERRRPLGVTILAIWALVASGFTFVNAVELYFMMQSYVAGFPYDWWYDLPLLTAASSTSGFVSAPLGSWITGAWITLPSESHLMLSFIFALILGVLYGSIGLYTFKASKFAWLGNVGISIMAAIALPLSSWNFYNSAMNNLDSISQTFGISSYFGWWTAMYLIYGACVGLRLYYLARPGVQDFFDSRSLFAQKRTA